MQKFDSLIVHIFSWSVFFAGFFLLITGNLPIERIRIEWVHDIIPIGVLEVSHLSASIVGTALLFVARAIQRRVNTAYYATMILLIAGMVLCLLKGFHWEMSLCFFLIAVLFVPTRKLFYRKASLLSDHWGMGWTASIIGIIAVILMFGLWSYKYVEYSDELWWKIGFNDDAPRFLRMTFGVAMFTFLLLLVNTFRSAIFTAPKPTSADLGKAASIVMDSDRADSLLALTGDKSFLFSESGKTFLMYSMRPSTMAIFGDPVGDPAEFVPLMLRARDMADKNDFDLVITHVSRENLYLYLDTGLHIIKLGEEAMIDLDTFTLEGPLGSEFRSDLKKREKEGCVFEVIPREGVPVVLDRLQTISDGWLKHKNTREKGFSLGFFDRNYLSHCAIAVVKKNSQIVAFMNVLQTHGREEISGDLIRYSPGESPKGVMDFLFVNFILWAKANGYRKFSMGMAPLAGLDENVYGGVWARIGTWIYNHGTRFYNFDGLRKYKDKFDPQWQSKYLAYSARVGLPRALVDIALLNSRGIRGLFGK